MEDPHGIQQYSAGGDTLRVPTKVGVRFLQRLSRKPILNVENVSAQMFLLVGIVFFFSACSEYNESASRELRLYQKTGQPSVLDGYQPGYLGRIP